MIQIVNDWVIGFFLHFSDLTRNTIYTENISKPFEKQTDVHIKCQSKNRIRFQNTENQYFLFFVSAKTLLF